METSIKLQKYLSQMGIASRRKAEEMIAAGEVQVNHKPAHIGQRVNPQKDTVSVAGKPVASTAELVYFLVDKPVGYISTTNDELSRKTVLNLLPPQKKRLFPVGRLDQDSQGLMLLTNDGTLAQQMTHPSFETKKVYHVLVEGRPSTKALDHLRRGVKLKEGYTKPADVTVINHQDQNTLLEIIIHEGRNRQIRRMMDRVGYPVLELTRTAMGDYTIDDLDGKPYKKVAAPTTSASKGESK